MSTPARCTSVIDVGGQNFRNIVAVRGLGSHPTFATDFAHACGTAFSGLSERLTARNLNAVAAAFGVRRRAVTLIAGASSRTKIVDVAGADPAVLDRLLSL